MKDTQANGTPSSILAVVALYNCQLCDSQAVSYLLRILNEDVVLAKHFSVILYDNSPQPQKPAIEASFPVQYFHDPSNGGLASAYNFALARAESEGREWLLLFDQDTSPTHDFLSELLQSATTLYARQEVGAIVPKLLVRGKIFSPEQNFLHQLRRQHLRSNHMMTRETLGLQQRQLNAYNSGAMIRVSALRAIGGFAREFWLDYLDHAVFSRLFTHGYRMFVMHAELEHQYSLSDLESIPLWRLENILLAQTLFVRQTGNFVDRLLYRLFLLRFSRGLRKSRKDPRAWRQAALQAFLLRVPETPRS
jgi:GT2 family glycosyltransferase